jgi:hypothetical protein
MDLMHKRCRLFLWAIISIKGLLFASSTFAAVTPTTADLFVLPGEQVMIDVPVQNTSSRTVIVDLSVLLATFSAESEAPQLENISSEFQSWITINPLSLELVSGETRDVKVSVAPPRDATMGVRTFALVAAEKNPGTVAVSYGTATLMFVTVGYPEARGECVAFLPHDDEANATLTLRNSGSGILVPNGLLQARGPFGIVWSESLSNPLSHRIVPQQERTWSTALPRLPWWSFGPVTYHIQDDEISMGGCTFITGKSRWLPLIAFGWIVIIGFGALILVRRR